MLRPTKYRSICRFSQTLEFAPVAGGVEKAPIVLTVDEYETVRLIDKEGLSQMQCAQCMQVARTTIQKIYDSARKKLADTLVDGCSLKIEGGAYQLCNGKNKFCGMVVCDKQKIDQIFEKPKRENIMRIAVTYENGLVFAHFGHTDQFKIYDVEGGKVVSSELISTNGQGHGALAEILNAQKVDTLICGGIGGGAQMALDSLGIKLYGGVTGSADEAVKALLEGKLLFVPDIKCTYHSGEHDGSGCGEHGKDDHECRHEKCES
ncbi:MAG: DUF134 domain-containing protein [Ruminococcus sp.]|nr:DUF134 domain-containing protein [Ruminococcus sp.]